MGPKGSRVRHAQVTSYPRIPASRRGRSCLLKLLDPNTHPALPMTMERPPRTTRPGCLRLAHAQPLRAQASSNWPPWGSVFPKGGNLRQVSLSTAALKRGSHSRHGRPHPTWRRPDGEGGRKGSHLSSPFHGTSGPQLLIGKNSVTVPASGTQQGSAGSVTSPVPLRAPVSPRTLTPPPPWCPEGVWADTPLPQETMQRPTKEHADGTHTRGQRSSFRVGGTGRSQCRTTTSEAFVLLAGPPPTFPVHSWRRDQGPWWGPQALGQTRQGDSLPGMFWSSDATPWVVESCSLGCGHRGSGGQGEGEQGDQGQEGTWGGDLGTSNNHASQTAQ